VDASTGYGKPRRIAFSSRFIYVAIIFGLLLIVSTALASTTTQDINPDTSDNSDADASSGGRVNGLANVVGNNQIFYAASEFGGLFKTTDGGVNWSRLNTHLPTIILDVEVDATNTDIVYATSSYDGRVTPLSGIEVSRNAGITWTHPATAQPNATFQCTDPFGTANNTVRTEPSAFGIGIQPGASNNVFIGTNCGLARSTDSGATWQFIDPTPGDNGANRVWDVVVQAGAPTSQGIIDVCGDDRHWRSTDGGVNWTGGAVALPRGRCSIAVSPDENYVLFVYAADNNLYESDDGGTNWTNIGTPDKRRQGRIPFVVTNQRSNDGDTNRFDLWAGDPNLFRAGCTTPSPAATGGALRCPMARPGLIPGDVTAPGSPPGPYTVPAGWAGPFTRSSGAHDDVGDIVFDSTVATDSCPLIFSSDGGVHRNLGGTIPFTDCQRPIWVRSNVGLHALWVWGMDGAHQAGNTDEDVYFGAQDNGSFASINAGALAPTWTNPDCCDIFNVVADPNRVLYDTCCFLTATGFASQINLRNRGMSGGGAISPNPPGTLPQFTFPDFLDTFGDKQYVAATTGTGGGLFITNDITASPVVWTQLGTSSLTAPTNTVAVQASVSGSTPTFYVLTTGNQAWRFVGTGSGNWRRIDNTDGLTGGFQLIAVDPKNPTRLYAATQPGLMVFSNDRGENWDPDPELDNLMIGGGLFKRRQPTLMAFDPEDANILVAGGSDSGVFLSTDGGLNWSVLTDPINSGTSGIPHLPRPRFAYFDHEPAGTINIYIGTQGRGVWRFTVVPPLADADGPYTTDEGVDVILDGSSSSDPGGATLTFEWDLDNDGVFDDATGPNPVFNLVCQDGVFPVALKVTAGGVFDTDQTTVTVNNVAPSVSLASNAPVNEGSLVTISGTVTDPGCLDPLTAIVDWGDGTPVQAIVGTLENVRPDATLTFSTSHVYGDNGNFTAKVCGSDDDTSTCQTIALQIDNVNPNVEIDKTNTVLVNGTPTFLAHADEPLDFGGRSIDPGSDDLFLSWDWDDGPPSPDVTTTYLVNPPDPDLFPSPSVQPRDVTDIQTHAFAEACHYDIVFSALDDDSGSALDTAVVLIAGNADRSRSSGDWQHQFGRQGHTDFDDATLQCYLAIVNTVSTVFSEARDASTIPATYDVLFLKQNSGSEIEQLDRELMTAWLNFANGVFQYDQMFDPDHDSVFTPFADIMAIAESVRLAPTSTTTEIRDQKNILQQLR